MTLYDSDEFYPVYYDNEIGWGYAQIFGSANVQTDYEYEIVSVRHTIKDEVLTSVLQLGSPFPTPSKLLRDITARDRFRGDLARGSRQVVAAVGGSVAGFGGVHLTEVNSQDELTAIEVVVSGVNFAQVMSAFDIYAVGDLLVYVNNVWNVIASRSALRTGEQTARLLEMLTGDDRLSYSSLKDAPVIPDEATLTGEQVRDLLQALVGTERLQYSALSGTPTIPALRNAADTYFLIQSLLDYNDLDNKPTIPTLRTAQETYDLIQGLLPSGIALRSAVE